MRTISWNKFDGGMTADPREPGVDVCRSIIGFDDYTRSYKLTPYRDMIKDVVTESSLDAYAIQKFVTTNSGIFGVGRVGSADAHTQVYSKVTLTDPTSTWTTAPGTSTSASSVEVFIQPVVYHNYIYGVNTGGVWKYGDITSGGGEAFTYNEYTTHVPNAQGLVHSKDDILYFPSGNLFWQITQEVGAILLLCQPIAPSIVFVRTETILTSPQTKPTEPVRCIAGIETPPLRHFLKSSIGARVL